MQEINFILNNIQRNVIADPQQSLLRVIREEFRLTGTKNGCSAGHCGTCAVLVDGKVVLACKYPMEKVSGKEVTTIEGIGTPRNPHPIQLAFAKAGAIQCGFCTPGMIVRAFALLKENHKPSREEIKDAFQIHLCRCTGYQKIFEAVELAASFMRGEKVSLDLKLVSENLIDQPLVRKEALDKALGITLYAADLPVEGCAHIKVLRSPHHHARINHIDKKKALVSEGVLAVFTAEDVDGPNIIKLGVDQPILCRNKVRSIGDPVAAVVATSEELAEVALKKIKVTYEPLAASLTVKDALEEKALRVNDDRANLFFQQPIIHGDIEKGFSEADVVVEHDYSTQRIEHAYMENDAGVAFVHENGQLVIMCGTQSIHIHHRVIAEALGLSLEQVRIIQTPMGGAFGGKNDISVGAILGFAAWKLKRPVKLVFTREETLEATSKRHPYFMKAKIGAKKDGTLTAYELDVLADGGAYQAFSGSVVTRGIIHASGPYRFPNAKIVGRAAYSNAVFSSAMRGYGVPQTAFAVESIIDELAVELGIDPLEIRVKNGYVQGDETVCGHILDDNFGFQECLETLRPHYERAVREARANQTEKIKRGVGVASAWFGPGRSSPDSSEAWAELLPDNTLKVWIGACDMGQGSDTMFWQIAAQTMGFPLERVNLCTTDTNLTPDGNFSAGSRQTHVSGRAVQLAVDALKRAMEENGVATYEEMKARNIPTLYKVIHKPETTKPDPQTGQCIPYETYSFGVQMAEVAVEIKTGKVKVLKVTAVYDPGTVINRLNVEGQIHGGISMGIGYALMEEFICGETDNLAKYKIPRAKDTPDMELIILGVPRKTGPFGASGSGEYGTVPTAPAITNAIYNACDIRIRDLPAKAEKIKGYKSKKPSS